MDDCIELSRTIEGQLDRDAEDFELNVSSAGADQPLKMTRQYRKNIGRDVEVVYLDGEKVEGELKAAEDEGFTLFIPGTKKQAPQEVQINYRDVKSTKVVIKF